MNEKPALENNTGEVEISDFLRLIGKMLTKIGNTMKWIFVNFFDLLILFFLFIKRKIVWLCIGYILGLAFGLISYYNSGGIYKSEMITKANFESSYFLYNQIDYFNSLIENDRINDLTKEFNISPDEAKSLIDFTATPVKSDIEAAKLYRQTFLESRRNHRYDFDTIWSKTLKFDEFKNELADYDFPIIKISVRSKKLDVFPKIQQGFLNSLNNNPYLKEKKENIEQIRKEEETLLTDALKNIDTLRQVYNRKLTLQAENTSPGGNQFILGERDIRNPELDLYDKSMTIKDELIELRMKSTKEKNVLELFSGFEKTGLQQSVVRTISKNSLYGLALVFIILIGIEFVRFLNRTEKSKQAIKREV